MKSFAVFTILCVWSFFCAKMFFVVSSAPDDVWAVVVPALPGERIPIAQATRAQPERRALTPTNQDPYDVGPFDDLTAELRDLLARPRALASASHYRSLYGIHHTPPLDTFQDQITVLNHLLAPKLERFEQLKVEIMAKRKTEPMEHDCSYDVQPSPYYQALPVVTRHGEHQEIFWLWPGESEDLDALVPEIMSLYQDFLFCVEQHLDVRFNEVRHPWRYQRP